MLVPDLEALRRIEPRQERLPTHQRPVCVRAGSVKLLGVIRLVQEPVVQAAHSLPQVEQLQSPFLQNPVLKLSFKSCTVLIWRWSSSLFNNNITNRIYHIFLLFSFCIRWYSITCQLSFENNRLVRTMWAENRRIKLCTVKDITKYEP